VFKWNYSDGYICWNCVLSNCSISCVSCVIDSIGLPCAFRLVIFWYTTADSWRCRKYHIANSKLSVQFDSVLNPLLCIYVIKVINSNLLYMCHFRGIILLVHIALNMIRFRFYDVTITFYTSNQTVTNRFRFQPYEQRLLDFKQWCAVLKFSNTSNMHILYVRSGHSLWIVLTWFDKLLYPVWISLIFSVHTFYLWIRRWWDFHSQSTVQSIATQHTFNIRHSMVLLWWGLRYRGKVRYIDRFTDVCNLVVFNFLYCPSYLRKNGPVTECSLCRLFFLNTYSLLYKHLIYNNLSSPGCLFVYSVLYLCIRMVFFV
jgi:hypothetical protein